VVRLVNACSLLVADFLAILTSYILLRSYRPMSAFVLASGQGVPSSANGIDMFLVLGGLFVIWGFFAGEYSRRELFWDGTRRTTYALLLVALPDLFLSLFVKDGILLFPAIASWLLLLLAVPTYRQIARRLSAKLGLWRIPTAMLGTSSGACTAYSALEASLSLGFDIRYLIVPHDAVDIPESLAQLERIPASLSREIAQNALGRACEQVVVTADFMNSPQLGEIVQGLISADIDVAVLPSLRGLPLFGMHTSFVFGKDILLLQVRNNLTRGLSWIVKGATDAIGAVGLIALFSPLLLAIAIAIKLDDGGPVLFAQRRMGLGGKEFRCFKFRTMGLDAEAVLENWQRENSPEYQEYVACNFKLRNDPRTTRVGRWLRRRSFDELPQLFNVVLGHMSLVGPRPLIAREVPIYGPSFQLYCRARPGLTGLWQISGRSETAFSDRVACDEWYILNWSIWYDLVILIKTAGILYHGKGAF